MDVKLGGVYVLRSVLVDHDFFRRDADSSSDGFSAEEDMAWGRNIRRQDVDVCVPENFYAPNETLVKMLELGFPQQLSEEAVIHSMGNLQKAIAYAQEHRQLSDEDEMS